PERTPHRSAPKAPPPRPLPTLSPTLPHKTPPESIPSTATLSSTPRSQQFQLCSLPPEPAETRAARAVPRAAPIRANLRRFSPLSLFCAWSEQSDQGKQA